MKKYEDELKNLQAKTNNPEIDKLIESSNQITGDIRTDPYDIDQREVLENQTELEKYKGLLLRQRDIMIAMTARLNNRDENIINLQSEIEMLNQRNLDLENELIKNSEEYQGSMHQSSSKRSPSKPLRTSTANSIPDDRLDTIKHCSDSLRIGLDLVINVLTKENSALDLGSIAQKLLGLQNTAHSLSKAVKFGADKYFTAYLDLPLAKDMTRPRIHAFFKGVKEYSMTLKTLNTN